MLQVNVYFLNVKVVSAVLSFIILQYRKTTDSLDNTIYTSVATSPKLKN